MKHLAVLAAAPSPQCYFLNRQPKCGLLWFFSKESAPWLQYDAGRHFCPSDTMKDMLAHLEKLHKEAAECERIARLATDSVKRELFTRLADHYRVLADEVERAVRNLSGSD